MKGVLVGVTLTLDMRNFNLRSFEKLLSILKADMQFCRTIQ